MNDKKYTLDRFEGDHAVFLQRPGELEHLLIPRSKINMEVKEGDIVMIGESGGSYHITVLKDATADQKEHVANLLNQLKNRKE